MRLYDTHCHFERADPTEIAAILSRAKAAGVEKLMSVGGSPALNESAALAAEVAHEAHVAPKVVCAVGYDREQAGQDLRRETEDLRGLETLDPRPVALGEIGLDYHYSPETREQQLKLFGEQLEEARRRDLPVVIHTREADDDTLALLREIPSRGIIHCYTGTPEYAKRFLDLGFYISISGIVTFKPAENVRASARVVPDDRILIETDSPFLAPVPMRGNPNEPAFIVHTCEFLAKLRGVSADAFAEQLEEAKRRDLPVVIHTREADDDTLALLREIPSRGIIHCYTGTPEYAKRFLDLGFYISISGIVTFKPAENVRAAALVVPDDRILIETDSPFLAPVPLRGQPNEPAFIVHTCEFLAQLRGVSAEAFADLTFANAERILG